MKSRQRQNSPLREPSISASESDEQEEIVETVYNLGDEALLQPGSHKDTPIVSYRDQKMEQRGLSKYKHR